MKKGILFILLSMFWIALLFPKELLWNNFAKEMKKQDISFVTQKREDKKYSFNIKQIEILYQNLKIAIVKEADIRLWILYNSVEIKNIELSRNLPMLKSLKISTLEATYTVISPKNILLKGRGTLGEFIGKIDIFSHKGYILLKAKTVKDRFLKNYFKKTKEGMRYEFSY